MPSWPRPATAVAGARTRPALSSDGTAAPGSASWPPFATAQISADGEYLARAGCAAIPGPGVDRGAAHPARTRNSPPAEIFAAPEGGRSEAHTAEHQAPPP